MPIFANIFQPLIDVFDKVLLFLHDSVGLGWGMSIIALTVVIRTLILPLTYKQIKSMQAMQRLAPEMKALQAKYKDDKQRLQEETMKFYKENNVNPFGSCLPLILQMPVFIALFYLLQNEENIEGGFLFIPDLTAKATGGVLVVLIVLYIASQLGSTLIMSATADSTQKKIFMALPFFFVIFIIRFPAGLILYWITTNTWTIGQSYVVRRMSQRHEGTPALATAGGGSAARAATASGGQAATAAAGAGGKGSSAGPPPARKPPPPPRKKKKRSGRRR